MNTFDKIRKFLADYQAAPTTALVAITLVACQQFSLKQSVEQPSEATRLSPLPQDSVVQVYFNHSQTAEYTDPYRQKKRAGDDLEQKIVDAIATAQSTVDVAVQEFRLPNIAQALAARKQAGVKVRVILENTYSRPWSSFTENQVAKLTKREQEHYQEFFQLADLNQDGQLSQHEIEQGDALVQLRKAEIPWIDDTADGSAGSGLMHHKFMVIDGQTVIVTSANLTLSDVHGDFLRPASQGNANNLLIVDSRELATLFTQEFNWMWGDGPAGKPDSKFGTQKPFRPDQQFTFGNTRIAVQFSPTKQQLPWSQSTNGLIGKTLSTATQSIDLALFVFSAQRLVNLLETRHAEGVQIRALIDPGFAYRSYSEALDMMGVTLGSGSKRKVNCQDESDNRPWQKPLKTVGVPRLPKGDLLHHKFGIVDDRIVITGSHNWTDAANSNNDETLLVIQSSTVAAHFKREFDRLYAKAMLGIPPKIQRQVLVLQKQCPLRPTLSVSESLVNLNQASQQELESLPGIGPQLAKRMIVARQQQPFKSLTDLDRLPGISPRMLENLRDRVTW